MPEQRLILHADDLGQSPAVNDGILRALQAGAVTSVSVLARAAAAGEAFAALKASGFRDLGLHLTLTEEEPAAPLADVAALLDRRTGRLPPLGALLARLAAGRVPRAQVLREWRAQIALLLERGLQPTHLDSHQHVHLWPGLLEIALELAREFGIPALRSVREGLLDYSPILLPGRRVLQLPVAVLGNLARRRIRAAGRQTPDRFYGWLSSGRQFLPRLRRALGQLRPGTTEWMLHPGAQNEEPRGYCRAAELAALLQLKAANEYEKAGVRLIGYRDL